ncbi:unnamed protein product [Orchesella dallaii]|uniref:Amino acid transporter n=1 Tax=Orchesella dallaii TaxID=48710 RepID=A0ABP1RA29_9HEXA
MSGHKIDINATGEFDSTRSSSPQTQTGKSKTKAFLRENLLAILTVIGVLSGVALGFGLRTREEKWNQREVMYVKFIGDLFLRMLKSLILPLIISSLISAVGGLDISLSGKIGGRAIAYYMITTVLAVALGIVLVASIQPGKGGFVGIGGSENQTVRETMTADTLMDLVRNMFPPNLVDATIKTSQTTIIAPDPEPGFNETQVPKEHWRIKEEMADGTNILGLVIFSAILGITLGKLGEKGKPLLNFFVSLSEAMMIITGWVIWLSPIGVCFLVAGQLINEENLGEVFAALGKYFMTVMAGLFIHGFIVLPLIYTVITRQLPFRFLANMSQALFTAFGTSSSSATLPLTIQCLEEKNGVDPRISRFVLPIGATINMDGTALYEAVAAIWIFQMAGKTLGAGDIISISITATAAAIGAAGIPQAGLVTMVMVLNTIGLPAEYVSYVVPVDWLLDRFRTVINDFGDSIGAGLVYHVSKKDLDDLGEVEDDEAAKLKKNRMEGSMTDVTTLDQDLDNNVNHRNGTEF